MNITSEEARIHPLGRVLPKRNHKTGSRPWVTGDFKKAELAWSIPQVEWTKLEERLMLAEMTRIGGHCDDDQSSVPVGWKDFPPAPGWTYWTEVYLCCSKDNNDAVGWKAG